MDTQTVPRIIYQVNIRPPLSIDLEAEGMSYLDLVARQRHKSASTWTADERGGVMRRLDIDGPDQPEDDLFKVPTFEPWALVFWIATMSAVGLIVGYIAVNS